MTGAASHLRRLRDVRLSDRADVGGKAASLGELLAAGVPVPDGVVLDATLADLGPGERRQLLLAAADALGEGRFAVRSSGLAEDGPERSFAGVFVSALDVSRDDLAGAADRVLASARSNRVAGYAHGASGRLAVIIQRMVEPVAAGVALTADPISGDRGSCIVTAVRGTGERLVSGQAPGDEWVIRSGTATARRSIEHAIGRRHAMRIAALARRIAIARATPLDIEWAIAADGSIWILQARPMTALPPEVSWEAPARGAYTRAMRFGEWIHAPVTPLFESWALPAMEDRLHQLSRQWVGQVAPRPHHVVVNGWYFYSMNFLSGRALLRSLPGMTRQLLREPRRVAAMIPPTVRASIPLYESEWRSDILPRYRTAVADASRRVETIPIAELPGLIDDLAVLAGEYFASVAVVAGAAYKLEMNLARFFGRHLRARIGGSHLSLLAGFDAPVDPGEHAVVSLDWWYEPRGRRRPDTPLADHGRLVAARRSAESAALAALSSSPRRLEQFQDLLAEAQRLVLVREEQVRELTIAWPAMRRAVVRIGEALAGRGTIATPDDVFFLTRSEVAASLGGERLVRTSDVAARRARLAWQARLVPPLAVGQPNPVLRQLWKSFPRVLGASPSDRALVSGSPASPGRATGPVRVIRGPDQFHELQPGDVLVAPLTAPAWTPLFARAAAVVTDVGSAASHASIIAREYGIPAVVGCGDATARLRSGMRVLVDGATGNVEAAGSVGGG